MYSFLTLFSKNATDQQLTIRKIRFLIRFLIRIFLDRLIQCDELHRKSKDKYQQHRDESYQILHDVADNDSPGSKEMMKRKKVENLHTSQEEAKGEQLVPKVEQHTVVLCGDDFEKAEDVEENAEDAEEKHGYLDPAEATFIAGIG